MKPSVSILPLRAEHLSSVAALETLCFSEPWSAQSLQLLLGEDAIGVVAVRDGEVVAYGGMTTVLDEGAVTNVAVHPMHWRLGYGRAVVRALLERAEKRGIAKVFLEVRASNLPAISLYEAEGFASCGRRKKFDRHPVEDALMMVRLIREENTI